MPACLLFLLPDRRVPYREAVRPSPPPAHFGRLILVYTAARRRQGRRRISFFAYIRAYTFAIDLDHVTELFIFKFLFLMKKKQMDFIRLLKFLCIYNKSLKIYQKGY